MLAPNDKSYMCKQSHKWIGTPSFKGVGMQITMPSGDILTTGSLCPYCLVSWIKEQFGDISEAVPPS